MSDFKLVFTLPGDPIAKQRHRTVRNGKHSYNPQKKLEGNLQTEMVLALGPHFNVTNKALILTFDAYFPRPKSHYRTGKNSHLLKGSTPLHHVYKPDYDNLVKFYKDVMNSIIYKDDCQVVGVGEGRKHYIDKSETGYVRIKLISLAV